MPIVPDSLEVRYIFEIDDPERGTFRDALTIPFDQWGSLTEADLQAMEQERYRNWIDSTTNAPAPAPADPVDVQSQAATLVDRLQQALDEARSLSTTQPDPETVDGGG